MSRRGLWAICACLVFLSGCLYPVSGAVDGVVCDLALQPRDLQPIEFAESPQVPILDREPERKDDPPRDANDLPRPKNRLSIPTDLLPGGSVPPVRLPQPGGERERAIERLFPPLPELGDEPAHPNGPEGRPLCLTDL